MGEIQSSNDKMASDEKMYERSLSGSRTANLLSILEKSMAKPSRKVTPEDLQQVKYATIKLQQILTGQDKGHKDQFLKNVSNIDTLNLVLQSSSDEQVLTCVVGIFIEVAGKHQAGKRVGLLVNHGVTNSLFQVLKDQGLTDDLLVYIHVALSKLGHKDRKFAVKARLSKTLLVTLNLIKSNSTNFRSLTSLLQVFKFCTHNSVNTAYLGKHNAITIMFKVTTNAGRKHTTALKLALDNINNLTKSKSNAGRTVGMGGVHTLLTLYAEWHHTDGKHRHLNIRKAILHILKNVTNLRSGRAALLEAEGIRILYETSQEHIDCREMESLILSASIIMRKCCPRNKLPLDDFKSAVNFALPQSDIYEPECVTTSRQGYSESGRMDDSDRSDSLDDDDDIDSDDDRFHNDGSDEPDDEQEDNLEPIDERSSEDLGVYDVFFPELFEFDRAMQETPESVVIPTASSDPMYLTVIDTRTQKIDFRRSAANLNDSYHSSTSSDTDLLGSRLGSSLSQNDGASSCSSMYNPHGNTPVRAVNLKTGSSVFSLDLQDFARLGSSKPKSATPSRRSSSRKAAKSSKKPPSAKDKKSKRKIDLTDALCITPMPSQIGFLDEFTSTDSDDVLVEDDWMFDPNIYTNIASMTKSAMRFEKMAYPDLHQAKSTPLVESLYNRKFGVQRAKVFEDLDRMIHPEYVIELVVYNIDSLVPGAVNTDRENTVLTNKDEIRIGRSEVSSNVLMFNSLFESGNLRKVIQIREFEYDLILNPDVNTNHHHQWFYFEVSNMTADVPYRFNIINCEKVSSQFNSGMRPVMYSVSEALDGRGFWKRVGSDICYYKNHFLRSSTTTGGVKGKAYYTTTFTIKFKHTRDICYLAYHYPYTYSTLMTHLHQMEQLHDERQIFFRHQTLCQTLCGNPVPLITITAAPESLDPESILEFKSRPYIFLSARVHPGESNASWIMKGTMDFLLSNCSLAHQIRQKFIFKIIPMLNPDGVINGNHRCSLVAEDLNRRWMHPCPLLHPSIYNAKGLLQYLKMINKIPLVFCDYHGHSRRKNIFLYGCSPTLSWIPNDSQNPASTGNKNIDHAYKVLPRILHSSCQSFSIQNSSFSVEHAKEATARVVVWRQIGVVRSYTMESSYCGCDQGRYKDAQMNTRMLEEMGEKFAESLSRVLKTCIVSDQQPNLEHLGASQGAAEINLDDLTDEYDLELEGVMSRDSVSGLDIDVDNSDEDEYPNEDNSFDDDLS